jgi:signal transduction histidine kinase
MQRAEPISILAGGTVAVVGIACAAASLDSTSVPEQWAPALLAALSGAALLSLASENPAGGPALYAGVIARLARGTRSAWALRAAVVLSAPVMGIGVAAYAAAALFETLTAPPTASPPVDWRRTTGTGMLGLAAVIAASAASLGVTDPTPLWAVLLIGSGLALFWGAAGTERSQPGQDMHGDTLMRTYLGLMLAAAGAAWVLGQTGLFHQAGRTVLGTSVVLAVLALVAGPWWLRSRRLLAAERLARVRAQERAEMADHLHDSVLQTLALIQRRSDDPAEVTGLARRQERDLREWLLERPAERPERSLAAGLRGIAAAVEDAYGVAIEIVTVGDMPVDEAIEAMIAAANEALVNAARHAQGAAISLFARVEDHRVSVYVHDRGPGFSLADVPPERRGVRESIIGRMLRHGGHAEVRSAPGEGCEVLLFLGRK